jgi:quercetin dioxygenase-like cupin family protein
MMAIQHAKPRELIDLRPLGGNLASARTHTLIKTDSLEVIRLVILAGKEIPSHAVPGEVVIQCLEGKVELSAGGAVRELVAGNLLFLEGSDQHSIRAAEDASLLVTILLAH